MAADHGESAACPHGFPDGGGDCCRVEPAGERGTPLADHTWEGDDDGHNCAVCVERNDTLNMCWPTNHPCGVCMEQPQRTNADPLCDECRLDFINRSDIVQDPVEQVLSSHMPFVPLSNEDRTMCRCGELFEGGLGYHRRHLAEKVYEALGIEGPLPWLLGADSATPDSYGIRQPRQASVTDSQEAPRG